MPKKAAWHDDWLMANCMDYESYQKLTDDYNELFDEHLSLSAIKNHCRKKLGISKPRQNIRHYTEEQREWLKENLPKFGRSETCRMFNERFNETRTVRAMKSFTANYGVCVSEDVWKKHITESVNKNKLKPLGTTNIHNGRLLIKTAAGERWKYLNRVVYEEAFGEIPKDYCIVHLDSDPMNCNADNLIAVPKSVLMTLVGADMKSEDPRITKSAILWCELKIALERSVDGKSFSDRRTHSKLSDDIR